MTWICGCGCMKMAPNPRVTRKWEVFAGRNKFFCDGYLMTAPHSGVFFLTVVLITGTSALFFAFDCPFLALKISPAIPIIGGLLYVFTMSSLLRTSFTDPGIIPRASHDEAAYIEKQIEVPNSLNSPTYRPPPRTKEVLVKGQTVKLKYCFTCKIFRPPRASHCSLCDNCVDRFDHHCPWVGNCVGKRNYRFFYMFIVSLAFLTVFIFTCATTHIVLLAKDRNDVTLDAIKEAPFSLIIAIICFLSVWSVIGLAGFHTYLTTSDQTTNEDIKGSFTAKGGQPAVNPYSRGNICTNCIYILCGPVTPSLIDRRGIVTDDYRVQMNQLQSSISSEPQITLGRLPPVQNQPSSGYNESDYPQTETIAAESRNSRPPALYDLNLSNGNSNSIAQLMDNEFPLDHMSSREMNAIKPDSLDEVHSSDLFSGSILEQRRTGSYSNLYKEPEAVGESHYSYSNLPQSRLSPERDPSIGFQHVYSNINLEEDVAEKSSPDDMDLDDLNSVATAFKGQGAANIQATTSTPKKSTSKAMKRHIIPTVAVIETSNNITNSINCPVALESPGKVAKDMNNLHNTTMIDCALDLDSIEGTIEDYSRGRVVV